VDHAVRDDHVDGVVGKRDVLDLALEELDVRDAGVGLVPARELEHLVGHVQAVGFAGRADAPGREQHVDTAAGPEVEHGLAGAELGERRRVAAAQGGANGVLGQTTRLGGVVEIRRDRVAARRLARAAAAGAARAASAAGTLLAADRPLGGLAVFLANHVLQAAHVRLLAGPMSHNLITVSASTALLREQHSAKRNPRSSPSAAVFAVSRRNVLSRWTRASLSLPRFSRGWD